MIEIKVLISEETLNGVEGLKIETLSEAKKCTAKEAEVGNLIVGSLEQVFRFIGAEVTAISSKKSDATSVEKTNSFAA